MNIDLNNLCRTCMSESHAMLPIFESDDNKYQITSTVLDMLQAFTIIQVHHNDGLPQSICLSCISDINRAFSFKQKSERSDITLRAYAGKISTLKTQVENKNAVSPHMEGFSDLFNSNGAIRAKSPTATEEIDADKNDSFLDTDCDNSITDDCVEEVNTEDMGDNEIHSTIVGLIRNEEQHRELNHMESVEDVEQCTFFIVFECGICAEQFTSKDNQRDHMLEAHSAKNCPKCDDFLDIEIFEDHVKSHDFNEFNEKQNIETEENETLYTLQDINDVTLTSDITTIGEVSNSISEIPIKYKCTKCNSTFAKERSLRLHNNANKCTEPMHECEVCKKVFARKRNLIQHMQLHSERKFKCPDCPREFSRQDRFNIHMQDHTGVKKHLCPYCAKGFNITSALKDHIRTHNGEKPYLCPICGKGFSQSTNLKQHIMRHNKTKPFSCETCETSFVSKGELETHVRKHTGDHPFVCDVCGKGFTTSSSLVKHNRIHTGERPYKCDLCPMRFAALGTLKNHRRTHTGERPYSCDICERKFNQKSDMVSHVKTHKSDVPKHRICSICNARFNQVNLLRLHMKSHENTGVSKSIQISKTTTQDFLNSETNNEN